jgi:hypothetical protein
MIVCFLSFSEAIGHFSFAFASDSNQNISKSENIKNIQFETDLVPPIVRITNPTFCSGIYSADTIIIQGTAYDKNGIKKVEAFANTIPHDGEFPFELVQPISHGNWSQWSIPLSIKDDEPHRILVRSFDNTGNENWDESFINSERAKMNIQAIEDLSGQSHIAFVEPTFTNAAYNEDSFYQFYSKYQTASIDELITTDLNLMTGDIPFESNHEYFKSIFNFVKQSSPDSIVSIIGDEEIHNGDIFKKNGQNAYELLILLHNEYVTQSEYNNLKQFLINGGSIILLDGNVFYAEVIYDEESCSITLVKGHDWEFDGNSVKKSVSERFQEENTKWFGSNFNVNDISDKIIFENNPFGYKHFEENFVTNSQAKILIDYNAKFPQPTFTGEKNPWILGGLLKNQSIPVEYSDEGKTIATYELASGTGKVLHMGIYSQNIESNPVFLDYFGKIILPRAIGNVYQIDKNDETSLYWILPEGEISQIKLDRESKILSMKAVLNNDEKLKESFLTLVLPKKLIDAHSDNKMIKFIVMVNGNPVSYEESSDDIERGLKIKISGDSDIQIIGTSAIPEFYSNSVLPLMLTLSITFGLILFNLPKISRYQLHN